MMKREFWNSAGIHLTQLNEDGWLAITPDFLRAYYTRPEVHPVDESCVNEIALHEALMADPFLPVDRARLATIADADAIETYSLVLDFRDVLTQAGTIEGAYLKLVSQNAKAVPPVFLDQMVHLILRNILHDVRDPMRLRAAELFFREQNVSTDDDRIMLADAEIVDMHARAAEHSGLAQTGLGQLLAESGTPISSRTVELDVLGDDNSDIYWERSDRFDTVIDFRFEQPAPDAFARIIEAWMKHMARLDVNIQPMPRIEDSDWRWHIGLDREASTLLNKLYEGANPSIDDIARIVGLYQMRIEDEHNLIERVKGHPVYLGLAMNKAHNIKMKPQNLLMNLPLIANA